MKDIQLPKTASELSAFLSWHHHWRDKKETDRQQPIPGRVHVSHKQLCIQEVPNKLPICISGVAIPSNFHYLLETHQLRLHGLLWQLSSTQK
jgi:hypothetical protein